MPLARYFLLVGAALLAVLFVAGALLPSPPAVERVEAQRTTIRIHSAIKLPERVVFDTSIPAVVHRADPVVAGTATPTTPSADDSSAGARQAFARMQSSDLRKLADARRPEIRSASPRKREASKRTAVPRKVRLARQHQFDWFGGRMWW